MEAIGVDNQYQGLNLSVKLYAWLITKKNLILISGMSQSPGGKSIWERLANTPNIFIFGYDVQKKESFQIDQKDLFNEDIYTDELQKEIDELQDEYSCIENKLYNFAKKNNISIPDAPEQNPAISNRMTKIDGQIESIRRSIRKATDYLCLVAIKNQK